MGFAISCVFYQAITADECKLWLYGVIRDNPIENIPDYIFDLADTVEEEISSCIYDIIGYVPVSYLSEDGKKALFGIAYLRNVCPLTDIGIDQNHALEALKNHSNILTKFNHFFPFIKTNLLNN